MEKTYDIGLHGYFDVLMMCFSIMLENIQPLQGRGTTKKKQVATGNAAGIDLQKSTDSRTIHKPKQLRGALLNACSVCNMIQWPRGVCIHKRATKSLT